MEKVKKGIIAYKWLLSLAVIILALIGVAFINTTTPPSIVSGVTKKGVAKLDDYDGLKVKLSVPDGKYVAFVSGGEVFQVAKVKSEKYVYEDYADDGTYNITAYATDKKIKNGTKAKKIEAIGSVKFKIPVENISSDDSDDEDSDSDYDDDSDYESDEEDTESDNESSGEGGYISEDPTGKSYRTDVSYDQLARNPDDYKSEDITLSGEVLQVIESDSGKSAEARIAINGDYDDVVLIMYDTHILNGSRMLEDDQISFSGSSLGTTSYKSTMSGNITVPWMTADKITNSGSSD